MGDPGKHPLKSQKKLSVAEVPCPEQGPLRRPGASLLAHWHIAARRADTPVLCRLPFLSPILPAQSSTYDDVTQRLAEKLSVADPTTIRLTGHNVYTHAPRPHPMKFRQPESLLDMMTQHAQVSGGGGVAEGRGGVRPRFNGGSHTCRVCPP